MGAVRVSLVIVPLEAQPQLDLHQLVAKPSAVMEVRELQTIPLAVEVVLCLVMVVLEARVASSILLVQLLLVVQVRCIYIFLGTGSFNPFVCPNFFLEIRFLLCTRIFSKVIAYFC